MFYNRDGGLKTLNDEYEKKDFKLVLTKGDSLDFAFPRSYTLY